MIRSEEKQKSGTPEKELSVTIDNGDFLLLDSLVDIYNFKDRDALLKFAIGALVEGINNEGLYTTKTVDGKKLLSRVAPSEAMLKQKPE